MDRQQNPLARKKLPTIAEAIEWQFEQASQQFGFYTTFPTRDQLNHVSLDTTITAYGNETGISTAMEQKHVESTRLRHGMEIMNVNRPLMESTEHEVHRRLLTKGKTQRDIDWYKLNKTSLRQKIRVLHHLDHPIPNLPRNSVCAWAYLGPVERDRTVPVNLPIKATLEEVRQLLKDLLRTEVAPLAIPKWDTYDENGHWKYQLVKSRTTIGRASVWLSSEVDYKYMINQLAKTKSRVAVLMQEGYPVAAKTPVKINGARKREAENVGVHNIKFGKDELDKLRKVFLH